MKAIIILSILFTITLSILIKVFIWLGKGMAELPDINDVNPVSTGGAYGRLHDTTKIILDVRKHILHAELPTDLRLRLADDLLTATDEIRAAAFDLLGAAYTDGSNSNIGFRP